MTQYGRTNRLDSWPVLHNSALRFHAARGECPSTHCDRLTGNPEVMLGFVQVNADASMNLARSQSCRGIRQITLTVCRRSVLWPRLGGVF